MPQEQIQTQPNALGKLVYDPSTGQWVRQGQQTTPANPATQNPFLQPQGPAGPSGLTEVLPDQIRTVGMILGLLPGLGPARAISGAGAGKDFLRLLTNMLTQGTLSGTAGAIEGNSPENVLKEAATSAGWELAGPIGSKVKRGSQNLGLRIGGVRGDIDKVLDAFERQSQMKAGGGVLSGIVRRDADANTIWQRAKRRDIFPTIHPGQPGKTTQRILETNKKLADTERAIPGEVNILDDFSGYTKKSRDKAAEGAVGGAQVREDLLKMENKEITDQMLNKLGWQPSSLQDKNVYNLFTTVGPQQTANARFLGNVKRDAAHNAKKLIEVRKSGPGSSYVPKDNMLSMQNEADLGNRARELQLALAGKSGAKLDDINLQLSDLFTINNTNSLLRGGGGVMTDLGQFGMRGGLGAGMASNIDPAMRGPLATVFMLLANPKGLSMAGGGVKGGLNVLKHKRRWDIMTGDEFSDREQ